MKIYENRNSSRRSFSCNYCYREGHNKRHCPHLKAQYLANKDWDRWSQVPPVGVDNSMFSDHYRQYWSDGRAVYQFRNHFDYAKKLYGETATTTPPRKRRKPKCGFCGSTAHNRRNCASMKSFIKVLEETERNYRSQYYDQVIDKCGFGVGAFVEYSVQSYDGSIGETSEQCLVTSFDLSSISIGNAFSRWSDYHTGLSYELNGNIPHGLRWQEGLLGCVYADAQGVTLKTAISYQHGWVVTNVIAPSPTTPDKEWFLGQSPAFDWVVKKKNLTTLLSEYSQIIRVYHPQGDEVVTKWWKKLKK